MTIWFTSDLHFGHEAIIRLCRRPFANLDEMHTALIRNWNHHISEHDTVYVLGDLALCPYREMFPIAEQLRGKKILIKGNHDHYSLSQYNKLGFQVFEELKLKLCGRMVRLSHYPYAHPWWRKPFAYKSELRFTDKRPPRLKGEILIHGHTHSSQQHCGNSIHVGTDAWNFRPVGIKQIESLLNKLS